MGRKKIDRTGEEGYNSFGSKMIISEYRHRVGSITYNNIINVKNTNISNNDILLKSIETSTIEITDLLKLYKNYGFISNNIMSLWDEYNFYKNSNYIFTKKEIKIELIYVIFI